MKILIAGGTGVLGRSASAALLAAGHKVTVLGRAPRPVRADLDVVAADALDGAALTRAVEQAAPEAVVNLLTAIPDPINPRRLATQFELTNRLRTEGTRNLVAAAREVGAERIVAESIAFGYEPGRAEPATEDEPLWARPPAQFRPVLDAVRALEQTTLGAGGAVLRVGHLIGPGTAFSVDGGGFAGQVRAGKVPLIARGRSTFSFAHVEDVSAAVVAAIEAPAGIYNVVDDRPAAMSEWLPLMAQRLDAKAPGRAPAALARFAVGGWGVAYMTRLRGASNNAATRTFGWRPAHPWTASLGVD